MVKSNMTVQLAAVASRGAAWAGSTAAPVLSAWETGVPVTGVFTERLRPITVPTMPAVQGTGVSTGGLGSGARQRYLEQPISFDPSAQTSQTSRNDLTDLTIRTADAKHVVDDIPGARSWSPPV